VPSAFELSRAAANQVLEGAAAEEAAVRDPIWSFHAQGTSVLVGPCSALDICGMVGRCDGWGRRWSCLGGSVLFCNVYKPLRAHATS